MLGAVRAEMAARLDDVAGWSMLVVDGAGGVVHTLAEQAPQPGSTVATGLDRAVQTGAEDAVQPVARQAMLVAIAPSTGQILAVAQNDAADAQGPVALAGVALPARRSRSSRRRRGSPRPG